MTPRDQLVLLLRTIRDFDYEPLTWTAALVQRQGLAGEGPTTKLSCRACGGEGRRRIRGVERPCDQCGARGQVVVDAYTERKVRTDEQEVERPRRMVHCDECGGTGRSVFWRNGDELDDTCRRCWGAKVVEGPSFPIRPFRSVRSLPSADAPDLEAGDPVLACMERRALAGSYEELGLALAVLRLENRACYRLLVRVFIEAEIEEDQLRIDQALELEAGLKTILTMMPAEIRVPSWAAKAEERRRARLEEEAA